MFTGERNRENETEMDWRDRNRVRVGFTWIEKKHVAIANVVVQDRVPTKFVFTKDIKVIKVSPVGFKLLKNYTRLYWASYTRTIRIESTPSCWFILKLASITVSRPLNVISIKEELQAWALFLGLFFHLFVLLFKYLCLVRHKIVKYNTLDWSSQKQGIVARVKAPKKP